METDAAPSRSERAYAAAIAVLVPVFFVAMWLGGTVRNGTVDTVSLKSEGRDFLALIGVLSVALWVGNRIPESFVLSRNGFLRAFIRFGIPLFTVTTLYFWLYPTSIPFAEHLGLNLFYAIIVSLAAKQPTEHKQR